MDLGEHADTLRTCMSLLLLSISAWKIVTDCLANLSTSVKLLTKAISIDFVICIGLEYDIYVGRLERSPDGRLERSPDGRLERSPDESGALEG